MKQSFDAYKKGSKNTGIGVLLGQECLLNRGSHEQKHI